MHTDRDSTKLGHGPGPGIPRYISTARTPHAKAWSAFLPGPRDLERNTGFERDLRLGKAKPSTLMAVGLLVDPRHDGGSQGGMERYAFRLGAFFEILPDSGREANRARDGRAGLRRWPGRRL